MPTSFVTAAVGGMSLATYTDADQISSYATTAMQWANENGLIIGGTDTTLAPHGTAIRAEGCKPS